MIIQLVAIPGAILISRVSEKFGNIQTLIAVVLIWVALCAGGYFITTDMQFYILGAVVGLVMGGIQSAQSFHLCQPDARNRRHGFVFQLLRCHRKNRTGDWHVQLRLC